MKRDWITWIVLLAFAVFFYFRSIIIPDAKWDVLGPRFFPLVLTYILFGLIALDIVQTLLARKRKASAHSESATQEPDEVTEQSGTNGDQKKHYVTMAVSAAMIIAYVFLIPHLGFLWATFLYLTAQMWLLTSKNLRGAAVALSTSVLATGAIHVVFERMLNIMLP